VREKPFRALFLFHGRLADFIPAAGGERPVDYAFEGTPAVKDSLEAQGLPHIEVGALTINGEPSDFTRRLADNDRVEVFPDSSALDPDRFPCLRPPLPDPCRFVMDVHLGRLARLLRLLGFDCLYDKRYADQEIVRLAVGESRIVLTRDIGLLKYGALAWGYWLRSRRGEEQLFEVLERFSLRTRVRAFTRCLVCNGVLCEAAKEDVAAGLEPDTRLYYDKFQRCDTCGRVYWRGSHWEKLRRIVEKTVGRDYST